MILSKFIARQLGHPSKFFGGFMSRLWDKRNAALNDAVFDSLALRSDDRVLDIGFGGGYLLGRMSSIVTAGFLAGVDVSQVMVNLCDCQKMIVWMLLFEKSGLYADAAQDARPDQQASQSDGGN